MIQKCKDIVAFIQKLYKTKELIPLHEPQFFGNEKKYLNEVIDSTFISSVGKFVSQFENMLSEFVGSKYAVATSNGTSALHIALKLVGVDESSEVITQPLTFVATVNAISYCGAKPIFVDVDLDTMGLSPVKLKEFLEEFAIIDEHGLCINKTSKKVIKACLPMHTFGHPCKIDEIVNICNKYNITVVEDAAESLGSYYKKQHTGTFGKVGIFSFNGNKIITSGGGGMIVTDDEALAKRAKHLTTTAKTPHPYEYIHDEIAYNYRLTNLAAAVGVAQMENIEIYIRKQRELAHQYQTFFQSDDVRLVREPENCTSNYWLNAVVFQNKEQRDVFLEYTNDHNVMTRPIWRLINKLDIYKDIQCGDLSNSLWLEERVVNISSSILK